MNISLTKELEQYIQQKVANGFYSSSSEVVREALRMLARFENNTGGFQQYKTELNQKIQEAIDSAENGELIPGDEAIAKFRKFRESGLGSNEKN